MKKNYTVAERKKKRKNMQAFIGLLQDDSFFDARISSLVYALIHEYIHFDTFMSENFS
jgi:hypothetical protein